jgi:hypothetical protein
MLEHWCANVDLQMILDHHAEMNYMVKYASKQERSGNTLQQMIKKIINMADVTDNAGSAFRSSKFDSKFVPLAIVISGKVKRCAFFFRPPL